MKVKVRFNKNRGQRGTVDHVWRVFAGSKEYLAKHVILDVPSHGERDGEDWNIVCEGDLQIDRQTATIRVAPL